MVRELYDDGYTIGNSVHGWEKKTGKSYKEIF